MATQRDVVDRTTAPAAYPQAHERTTGQIIGDIVDETRTLVRQEIELAKLEVKEAVSVRVQALAAAAAAAFLGFIGLVFALVTVAMALATVLEPWAAWLIVTGGLFLLATVALLIARSRARAVPMEPEKTKRSIEENVRWARTQLRR